VLVVVLFSVCSEKALRVMDQTLRGRSHHDLVNSFAKKNFREISENQPAYQIIKYRAETRTPLSNLEAEKKPLTA
jgi:hypothetical protein